MPRPDRPNEVLVSRILADEGSYDVGDPAPLVLVVPDESSPDGLGASASTCVSSAWG